MDRNFDGVDDRSERTAERRVFLTERGDERDARVDQSFIDRETADAFADAHGGDVEPVGTAFVVHPDDGTRPRRGPRLDAAVSVPAAGGGETTFPRTLDPRTLTPEEERAERDFPTGREAFPRAQTAEEARAELARRGGR